MDNEAPRPDLTCTGSTQPGFFFITDRDKTWQVSETELVNILLTIPEFMEALSDALDKRSREHKERMDAMRARLS